MKDAFFLPQRAGHRKLQLNVDVDVYDELERIAKRHELKVTEVVRQMIVFALTNVRITGAGSEGDQRTKDGEGESGSGAE